MYLKHCVQIYNLFDFLRDIVGMVPDLADSHAAGEDRCAISEGNLLIPNCGRLRHSSHRDVGEVCHL
nr:dr1-associated corepressor-like [Tanacetum cinerariifolium]